jgi:hypothetical protein
MSDDLYVNLSKTERQKAKDCFEMATAMVGIENTLQSFAMSNMSLAWPMCDGNILAHRAGLIRIVLKIMEENKAPWPAEALGEKIESEMKSVSFSQSLPSEYFYRILPIAIGLVYGYFLKEKFLVEQFATA